MEIKKTEPIPAEDVQQEGIKTDVHEVWIYTMDGRLIGTEWRINDSQEESS